MDSELVPNDTDGCCEGPGGDWADKTFNNPLVGFPTPWHSWSLELPAGDGEAQNMELTESGTVWEGGESWVGELVLMARGREGSGLLILNRTSLISLR